MGWVKRGLVYAPDGSRPWARRYAAFPTPDLRDDGVLRVYFTALDGRNDGRTGYVDLDPDDPTRVIAAGKEPVLDIGGLGDFDECGATIFGLATIGDRKLAYYQGWQRCEKVPYLIFVGLAISDAQGSVFRRHGDVPLLDRTQEDRFIRGAPFIMRDGKEWRMWYVSSTEWRHTESGPRYNVVVRTARSLDGIDWSIDPQICLAPSGDEYAIGRPCLVRDGDLYRMWYAIRSASAPYRIGYAESDDGILWQRRDGLAGIHRSASGWDSEMICYPYVIDVKGRRFMFYNGNRHGATGFGCAEYIP